MRNADYNQDPRGWSDRPSPAGRSRRRSVCRARLGNGPGFGQFTRRSIRGPCLRTPVSDPLSYARGITPHSSSWSLVPPVPDSAEMVSLLLEAAQEHFTAGCYAAAEAFLKLIRVPDMDPATTWQQLGQLHFSLADYEAAGRAYGYAAAYDPRDASLQVRLGHICLLLEDIPGFEGYLRRALALDSKSATALQLLADLNRDEGRYADAADYYDRIIQATPGQYENLLSLALCHSYLGAQEAAMDCLQRAGQIARGTLFPTVC